MFVRLAPGRPLDAALRGLPYRVATARYPLSRLMARSTTLRSLYASASNFGGRPPLDPLRLRCPTWSEGSAITALTTPALIRIAGPVASYVDRKLPRPIQTFGALSKTSLEAIARAGEAVQVFVPVLKMARS